MTRTSLQSVCKIYITTAAQKHNPLMSTKIDYNCSLCIAIFKNSFLLHDSRLISEGEKNQIESTAKFQLFFLHHFGNTFSSLASYFSECYFFYISFLFRRVESEMWERERETQEKKQQAHSKLYVSLLVGAPVYTTITTKKGEKKEFPDFIIIFQHLYFYVENFFLLYFLSTFNIQQ